MPKTTQPSPTHLCIRIIGCLVFSLLSSCGLDNLDVINQTTNISGTLTLPITGLSNKQQSHSTSTANNIPGEFIITTSNKLTAQSLTKLNVNGVSLKKTSGIPELGIWFYKSEINTISSQSSSQILIHLKNTPGILSAEHNTRFELYQKPDDEFYFLQWHFQEINAQKAWNLTNGNPVNVAVVDTGIVKHPDLDINILPGIDTISDPELSFDNDGRDLNPIDSEQNSGHHGTHVAGTIAAIANNGIGLAGLSWNAKIIPVRALTSKGGSTKDILAGISWAAGFTVDNFKKNPNPAKVINLSLGSQRPCSIAEQLLFHKLAQKDIITIVAAGNDNKNTQNYSPASCNNVITVGATAPGGTRASYSNYGSRIDIMAPGGNNDTKVIINDQPYAGGIYSTILDSKGKPSYGIQQGTSMAAPHVSGAVALLLGEQPNMSFHEVRTRLKFAADPLGNQCDIPNGCGAGLLNVGQLIEDIDKVIPQKPTEEYPLYVGAFYELQPMIYDQKRSIIKRLSSNSYEIPYTLDQIKPGNYRIIAFLDINYNKTYEEGEPYGVYENIIQFTGQEEGFSGINLKINQVDSLSIIKKNSVSHLFNKH